MSTSNANYGLQKSMAQTESGGSTAKPTLNSAGLPLNTNGTAVVKPFGTARTVKELPAAPMAALGAKAKLTKQQELVPFPKNLELRKSVANFGKFAVKPVIKRIPVNLTTGANTSAASNSSSPMTAQGVGFDGLTMQQGGGWTPPDVQAAAGGTTKRTLVFEMVNLAGAIWDKDHNPVKTAFPLSQFFQTGSDSLSDPQIVFDTQSGHWFAAIMDITKGSIIVGVSNSDDAMGVWHFYSLYNKGQATITDQPIIATSRNYFMVSVNDFDAGSSQYQGAEYVIANKTEMIMNVPSLSVYNPAPDTNVFSVHPVQSVDPTNPSGYMVSVNDGGTDHITLYIINGPCGMATGCNLAQFVTQTSIPLTFPSSTPPSANQPGNPTSLNTGDGRLLTAASSAGKIWLGFNDNCPASSGSGNIACIRLDQIDLISSGGGGPILTQDFNVAATDNSDLFYPALSIDSTGVMRFILGISSTSQNPSLLGTDETLSTAFLAKAGSAPDLTGRYGDYFGAGLGPDGSTIWTAGEYGGPNGWRTWIQAITP
jgi:hypothetical protein